MVVQVKLLCFYFFPTDPILFAWRISVDSNASFEYAEAAILKSKKFYGPISASQTNFCFPKLHIFDLSHNEFSSSLAAKVFVNFRAMTRLRGANKGESHIWNILSFFDIVYEDFVRLVIKGQDIELERITKFMTAIDLYSNHFDGKLNMLEVLDLSWNWLTGKVQQELAVLNLSQNLLVGHIPRGPPFNTFENDSYGGNLD
ncbi:receptor-like protein 9DC3 [Lycium barbarum]|uniref:receptor-like protein 9DC3 n=1 Tax=Lycium barbarum TaxID=112863 RepID=UPI00293E06C8|nr:receptor-like protein 9DC3 [Lycium barbarum]